MDIHVKRMFSGMLLGFAAGVAVTAAPAHSAEIAVHQKYLERINGSAEVGSLKHDLFGDNLSLKNGFVEFSVVDIDVPGNSVLPVQLRRTLAIEDPQWSDRNLGGFGIGGGVDIPYLKGTFGSQGWQVNAQNPNQRCSQAMPPRNYTSFLSWEYWNGYWMHMPGSGSQALLANTSPTIPNPGTGNHPWITKEFWTISCKAATKNGYPGEAFIAHSPEGIKYHFDWVISKNAPLLKKEMFGFSDALSRVHVFFLVSRMEDRFGNWVDFGYDAAGLKSITSSDGRYITITRQGELITSVSSSVGTWSYSHGAGSLTVTRPDGSQWQYQSAGTLFTTPSDELQTFNAEPTCMPAQPMPIASDFTYAVTHPSGAKGEFLFKMRRHYRHNIPKLCNSVPIVGGGPFLVYLQWLSIPNFSDSFTLVSKEVSGPGLSPMSWSYRYGIGSSPLQAFEENCAQSQEFCSLTMATEIEGPDDTFERHHFGAWYRFNEGRLHKVERGRINGGSKVVESAVMHDYLDFNGSSPPSVQFPSLAGNSLRGNSDEISDAGLRPLLETTTTQDGVDFTWRVNTNCPAVDYCFDVFARPLSVTRSSTVMGNPSRTEVTQYHDNLTRWVLGQQAGLTVDGIVASETSYEANALPTVSRRFGRTLQTLGYDTTSSVASGQRGTLRTVADGNGNVATLSSWKRGVPQSIQYPATPEAPSGATQSALVNDHGWITRITDENGFQTNYQYDPMGRLSRILHPAGDSVAWSDTILSFTRATGSAYGIPAGHWQRTVATGNGRKVSYLDALWRPLLVREYDTGNASGTQRFTRQTFDHEGRATFASYPSAGGTPTTGTWTEYDALGRPTSVAQDSELGLLTTTMQYLSGLQTRVTNPRGEQTTTRYLAWDQPMTDYPVAIAHPGGAFTDIDRDVFGKPTALTRRNAGGNVSLTRSYVYDAHQQLCKSVEPETGATIMAYDNAGNLAWSRAGATQTGTTSCNTGNVPVAQRTVRSYDARNRIQSLTFPDNLGNTFYSYEPDGLLSQITVDNGGAGIVSTAYTYNRRRLPIGEAVGVDSHQWGTGYGYNANGHLQTHTLPGGLTVDYAPNALGQPTRAGSYATGATYFPNGAIRQFTYGNGIVHTLTQNARGLPDRRRDAHGGTGFHDDSLDYDQHGNVAAISDGLPGNRGDRTMTYDALDRLTGTVSPMFGTATYAYDVLDNLNRVWLTSGPKLRDHTYAYDASNRLNLVTNTSGGATVASLSYDVQGNLASRNGQVYQFDYGNRLRDVPGAERYLYDGHGRRVKATRNGASIYSVYGQDGVLRYQRNEHTGKTTEYVHLAGSLVAELVDPVAPTGVPILTTPAASTTGSYTVSWTSVDTATRYELQERLGAGSWSTIHNAAGTSRSVSGKTTGVWGYRVRSCNTGGCGPYSSTRTTTVTLAPADAPTLTAPASNFTGSYAVSWTTVASATRYELQERINGGSWSLIQDSGATSRPLSGKTAGAYGYRVRACNIGGCAGYSAIRTTQVTLPPTAAPALTAPASNFTGSYTVSWTTVATATRYELQQRKDGGGWSKIHDAAAVSKGLTGQVAGRYDYRVRACNIGGCAGYSTIRATQVTFPPSAAPVVTAPAFSNTSFTVSWTSVATATRYELATRLGSGNWETIYNSSGGSMVVDPQTTGSWGYRARGCNVAGCGPYSAIVTVGVISPPGGICNPICGQPQSEPDAGEDE